MADAPAAPAPKAPKAPKAAKVAKPKAPKAPASHPPYVEMIKEAIASLKVRPSGVYFKRQNAEPLA